MSVLPPILDITGPAYPAWMDAAACTGSEVNFFPEKGYSATPAREVCAVCPVRVACLQWALDSGAEYGIYGGLTAHDRRGMRRGVEFPYQCPECLGSFRNARAIRTHRARYCGVPVAHGTHATYSHGCKCDLCKEGHAAYERRRRAGPGRAS